VLIIVLEDRNHALAVSGLTRFSGHMFSDETGYRLITFRDHHFIARFQIVDQVEVLRRDPAEPQPVPVAPA
jgi:hypothetical protein